MSKLSGEIKEELNHFFEILEKVQAPSDPRSKKLVFDMGLIIFEANSSLNAEDVFKVLPQERAHLFKLTDCYDWENFSKELVIANKKDQWFFVDCQANPSSTIIGILKQISSDNTFTLLHFEDKELFRMTLNSRTRIVFAIQSDFLEREISYPYFINLFGPVIRI